MKPIVSKYFETTNFLWKGPITHGRALPSDLRNRSPPLLGKRRLARIPEADQLKRTLNWYHPTVFQLPAGRFIQFVLQAVTVECLDA
eukprot:5832640-Amphidinium_carterae.1